MAAKTAFEIFRPGTYTALSGQSWTITEDDLRATVDAYDPALHEAPFVKGHPKIDAPAYGWVSGLAMRDGALVVTDRRQVEPAFAEDVRQGRYKKRSASFWPPDHPSNPTPGVFAIKHVGFLGAAPPAVKGMPDVAHFGEDPDGVLVAVRDVDGAEFADAAQVASSLAYFLRGMREFVIDKFSRAEADDLIPEFLVREAESDARADDPPDAAVPAFTDPNPEHVMPEQPKQPGQGAADDNTADFAAREAQLNDREAKLAEQEQAIARQGAETQRAETAAFVDGLVDAGTVLPRDRDFLVAFVAGMDDEAIEFGEGADHYKGGQRERFKSFLQDLPPAVDLAERAAAEATGDAPAASFAGAERLPVDRSRAELHAKAKKYQANHECSFADAVAAVGG